MKIFCTNTAHGLVPNYDSDFDEKKKLKIGKVYSCEIRLTRNYEFHKKYFALLNCAWEYLNEATKRFFSESKYGFRKTVEIAAGWYEKVYSFRLKDWVEVPKSISFESMDEGEFNDLYERVKDVLFQTFLRDISEEEFMKHLIIF